MLEVKNLFVNYGAISALEDLSFHVEEGEIVALIGANGAGKSTTLRAISGLVELSEGEIKFKGETLNKLPSHEVVQRGISHVPEGRRVFPDMTVLENLEMGAYLRKDPKAEIKKSFDEVFAIFPRLMERRKQLAGTLSGGEQQMLAMGRALMAKPKLLLLDEPSMGLAPLLVDQIFSTISQINKAGTTILLVEQNANMALQLASRAYVLETGQLVLSGDASSLANDPQVKKAYLGED
jgi:branched-chain amino acid transport system ATP-binding protein